MIFRKVMAFLSLSLLTGSILVGCGGGDLRAPANGNVDAELSRCLRLSSQKKYDKAVECLEIFKSRHPGGDQAADADLMIADSSFRQKEYIVAAESYAQFIKQYPYHPKIDYAYYKSGLAYLSANPSAINRDQQYLDLAVQNFAIVDRYYSNSPYAAVSKQQYNRARLRQAQKHYSVGRFYYKYGEYLASIPRFEEIVINFPSLGLDEKSFYYLVNAYAKTNQPERAREALLRFEERYPKSSYLNSAKSKVKGS